ncbi:MAG: hypothetical protein LBT43_04330, partial [Prevotella sp.]|nr:hypothetical protein [Prevotella sp.]
SDRCSMWGRSNAILQNIKKWPEEKSSDHDWVVVSLFFELVATVKHPPEHKTIQSGHLIVTSFFKMRLG